MLLIRWCNTWLHPLSALSNFSIYRGKCWFLLPCIDRYLDRSWVPCLTVFYLKQHGTYLACYVLLLSDASWKAFFTQVGKHFSRKLTVNLLCHGPKNFASRIPNIFGKESGHFQKVATNISIFGMKRPKYHNIFKTNLNSKLIKFC